MIKTKNISKGKVQNMMNQGAFKNDLTVGDIEYVEEFMHVEVGYRVDGIGVCPSYGSMTIGNGEFYYKGKEYGMIHLTFNNEIVLIGNHGGLIVKWKNILKTINSKFEENGKVYDTKTAKFISRKVPVINEEPMDAVIFDFYQTPEGDYFTHTIGVIMEDIAEMNYRRSGVSRTDARYHLRIEPVSNQEIIEKTGSLEAAQELFNDIAPNLNARLFDVLGDPCEACGACG